MTDLCPHLSSAAGIASSEPQSLNPRVSIEVGTKKDGAKFLMRHDGVTNVPTPVKCVRKT